jgi:hypothetical protein
MLVGGRGPNPNLDGRMTNNNNAMTDDRYRLMAPSVQHVNLHRLIQTYSLLSDKGTGTVDDVMGTSNYNRPLPNASTESCVRAKPGSGNRSSSGPMRRISCSSIWFRSTVITAYGKYVHIL